MPIIKKSKFFHRLNCYKSLQIYFFVVVQCISMYLLKVNFFITKAFLKDSATVGTNYVGGMLIHHCVFMSTHIGYCTGFFFFDISFLKITNASSISFSEFFPYLFGSIFNFTSFWKIVMF